MIILSFELLIGSKSKLNYLLHIKDFIYFFISIILIIKGRHNDGLYQIGWFIIINKEKIQKTAKVDKHGILVFYISLYFRIVFENIKKIF